MIGTTTNRWPYDGDGVNPTFAYTNRIDDESWMKLYVDDVLVDPGDYTVTGVGLEAGGSVIATTPPPTGTDNVVLLRVTPITQLLSIMNEGPFLAANVERLGLDNLAMMIQDIHEILGRCPKFPVTSALRDFEFATPSDGGLLRWDLTNDQINSALASTLEITHVVVDVAVLAGESSAVIPHNLGSVSAKIIGFSGTFHTAFKFISQTANAITVELTNEAPVNGTLTFEVAL